MTSPTPPLVSYRVSMARRNAHLFDVEAHFPEGGDLLTVALPVWTPGNYRIHEHARHLQQPVATTQGGAPLPVHRTDKCSYEIHSRGQAVTLRYCVYAHELTAHASHLDASHGYFNGTTLFLYAEPLRSLPHRVTVESPEGWTPFCALDRDGDDFIAPDYDTLVDSPFEVGPHTPLRFSVAGVPHEVVIWGEPKPDAERLTAWVQRICEMPTRLFGVLPIQRYLFLIYLTDKGRGALEHQASSVLLCARSMFQNTQGWESFLSLAAHEYFHLWHVKRIRPAAFFPLDYRRESYTSLLWTFEGTTSYYENIFLLRAGLMSASRFLIRLGEKFSAVSALPGRKVQTLADASRVAWIHHGEENSSNSTTSYYIKGELVSVLLDLEIRRVTKGKETLHDVMRLLWRRYGDGAGVPEDGVERAAAEVAGVDLSGFFNRALRSTEELDVTVFDHVGLELRFRERDSLMDKGGSPSRRLQGDVRPRGWIGLLPKGTRGISEVLEGSPAMEAGLCPEDEIVALDGFRVDATTLLTRCDEMMPGERLTLTLFRRDQLLERVVTVGPKPQDAAYFALVDNPTDEQKGAFQAWLGVSWQG